MGKEEQPASWDSLVAGLGGTAAILAADKAVWWQMILKMHERAGESAPNPEDFDDAPESAFPSQFPGDFTRSQRIVLKVVGLAHVDRRGPLSLDEIAVAAAVNRSTVREALSRAEALGLVARRRDRKQMRVQIVSPAWRGWLSRPGIDWNRH